MLTSQRPSTFPASPVVIIPVGPVAVELAVEFALPFIIELEVIPMVTEITVAVVVGLANELPVPFTGVLAVGTEVAVSAPIEPVDVELGMLLVVTELAVAVIVSIVVGVICRSTGLHVVDV